MGGGRKRSKKQSGGKRTARERRRESSVVYIEESLCNCQPIQKVFEKAGIKVERHYAHFPVGRKTPDHEWLTLVGQKGWIALTKDKKMRRLPMERAAIKHYGIKEFCFSSGDLDKNEMAGILTAHLERMLRLVAKHQGPFEAALTQDDVHIRDEFKDDDE
jgi:hypothetical protein